MPTPAQNLTKNIRQILTLHGWLSFKCAAGMVRTSGNRMVVYGTAGAPDIVAVRGQRYVLIEVKAGKDRLQPSQLAFRAAVRAVNGNYLVARSVDDVLDWVKNAEHNQ